MEGAMLVRMRGVVIVAAWWVGGLGLVVGWVGEGRGLGERAYQADVCFL